MIYTFNAICLLTMAYCVLFCLLSLLLQLPLRWRLPLMVVAAVPRYCMYLACCRQFDIAMSPLLRSAANLLAYVSAAETFRIIFMRGVHRQRMMSLPSSPSPSRSSPLRMADTVWGRAEGKARFLKQD